MGSFGYRPQEWSLPESIIFYMAKNPSTPKIYQKLVKTCKYFAVKNPLLFVDFFSYINGKKWLISRGKNPVDLDILGFKLWITGDLNVFKRISHNQNILSSILPKIYKCNAKSILLEEQLISFTDFQFLFSSAEKINFHKVIVKNENGAIVPLEKLVEALPNIKRFFFKCDHDDPTISSNTVKELLKLQNYLTLGYFELRNVPKCFDIESYHDYTKTFPKTEIRFYFDDSISQGYKNRLKEINDKNLVTHRRDEKYCPLIYFPGQDPQDAYILHQLD